MLERFHSGLRLVCLALAGLVLFQIARLAAHHDPNLGMAAPLPMSSLAEPSAESKGTNSGSGQLLNQKRTGLSPADQARVDRITQSEIFGTIVRPLPMALLGIGGRDAFLRTPNGQTGLLREGEVLGGVKLLRIGTNRVLIEHEQQQKELMLFSGFGGESLLPKTERISQ